MYHRYPKAMPRRMSRRNRNYLWLAVILLAVLCGVLFFFFLSAQGASSGTRTALVEKTQNEVSQARNRAYSLSQTSGSSTAGMVAQVRQHIYGVRVLNELSISIFGPGNSLVTEASINLCLTYLDQCDQNLQTGATLTQTFTLLREAIEKLYEEADLL